MKVEYIAKIEVPTTSLQPGSTREYDTVIGTGYPVRQGLVLTARHVVFPEDRDLSKPIRLVWRREDEGNSFHEANVSDIVFESVEFDIAVLACDTESLAGLPWILADAGHFPVDGARWKSHGYPTAGKERGIRIKNPASGTFQPADPHHYVQWLTSEGNVAEDTLWQGMSGAPVFDQKNRLVAVIIRTPVDYLDSEKKLKPTYQGRLIAASIPYLLSTGKCDKFREIVTNKTVAEQLLPGALLASDFDQWLKQRLAAELAELHIKTPVLHEQLIAELGKQGAVDAETKDASSIIANELLSGHDFESAADILAAATCDCIVEGGLRYSAQLPLDNIRATAENALGWLVLRAIDEAQLHTVLPMCHQHSSLFFSLKSVQSLAGIEIVMARRLNRKPDFNNRVDSEQESRYRISMPAAAFKWEGVESVRRVFIEIWNQVFITPAQQKELHESYTSVDVRTLNSQLRKRRTHRRSPEHFYLSFTATDYAACPDFIEGIYRDLLGKLSEMTVIEYGSDNDSAEPESHLFVIPEEDVRTTINLFYEEINGTLGNRT